VIFQTDDCRGTYESLRAAGVEFTQEPTERFYGTDCALRDPFGNQIRFTQPPEGPIVVPSAEELQARARQSSRSLRSEAGTSRRRDVPREPGVSRTSPRLPQVVPSASVMPRLGGTRIARRADVSLRGVSDPCVRRQML